ncbi:MAG: hypothetical protein PUC37_09590 [Spirochaetales bacterium]|nr:hypothetical protein [Spirochaetales bacterium]
MQELRSTDILDKEIQADARKKADRILRQAEVDCEKIISSVSENIKKAEDDKTNFYALKIQALENDKKATLPLEKERFQVSFMQQQIVNGINKYLSSLSVEQQIKLAIGKFDFSSVTKNVTAYIYGFSVSDVEKVLKNKLENKLLACKETQFNKLVIEEEAGLENPKGIILEAEDLSFRCRLTITQSVSKILDKKRSELSQSLFGGQL